MKSKQSYWYAFFECNRCFTPLIAQFHCYSTPHDVIHGNLLESPNVTDLSFFPERKPSLAPDHVPQTVARAFVEADISIRTKSYNAAAAMDRRTLEMVTKDKAPEKQKDTLYQRIEYLAAKGELPRALKEWAHGLRSLGNEALHSIEDVTDIEARQAHDLTRFILIYLYTLPMQVDMARALRE